MMTRKDYVRTAEILNDHLVSLSPTDINGSRSIYDTVARLCGILRRGQSPL